MRLFLTQKAAKELDKIPNPIAKKIINYIQNLSQNPRPQNSKKLHGQNNYRLRIGAYRTIYTIDKKKKEITILRIAHRKTIYR